MSHNLKKKHDNQYASKMSFKGVIGSILTKDNGEDPSNPLTKGKTTKNPHEPLLGENYPINRSKTLKHLSSKESFDHLEMRSDNSSSHKHEFEKYEKNFTMQSDLVKLAFDLPFMSKKQRKAFRFKESAFEKLMSIA